MKTHFALIGMLALAACEKEKTSQSAVPSKIKALGAEHQTSHFKPTALKPKSAVKPEMAQAPASPPEAVSPPIQEPPQAAIVQTQSVSGKTTEQLRDERLARMAKAREERAAQIIPQIAARMKQQDANGDGLLAKTEVDARMQRRFDEADKNKDGVLDATEQQTMIEASAQRISEWSGQRRGNQGGGPNNQRRRNQNP